MSRTLAAWLLLLCLVLPSLIGVAIFGYSATVDWAALQSSYRHFQQVATESPDMQTLFVAEADQNIHRINLFADGVWTLLSALIGAIGLHGLCRPNPQAASRHGS